MPWPEPTPEQRPASDPDTSARAVDACRPRRSAVGPVDTGLADAVLGLGPKPIDRLSEHSQYFSPRARHRPMLFISQGASRTPTIVAADLQVCASSSQAAANQTAFPVFRCRPPETIRDRRDSDGRTILLRHLHQRPKPGIFTRVTIPGSDRRPLSPWRTAHPSPPGPAE